MGESSATEIRLWRKKYKFRASKEADGIPAQRLLQARGLAASARLRSLIGRLERPSPPGLSPQQGKPFILQ